MRFCSSLFLYSGCVRSTSPVRRNQGPLFLPDAGTQCSNSGQNRSNRAGNRTQKQNKASRFLFKIKKKLNCYGLTYPSLRLTLFAYHSKEIIRYHKKTLNELLFIHFIPMGEVQKSLKQRDQQLNFSSIPLCGKVHHVVSHDLVWILETPWDLIGPVEAYCATLWKHRGWVLMDGGARSRYKAQPFWNLRASSVILGLLILYSDWHYASIFIAVPFA